MTRVALGAEPAKQAARQPAARRNDPAEETTMDETQRERILAQIEEIAKRHGKADDESLGELLARAAGLAA